MTVPAAVHGETREGVLTITLDRPSAGNALRPVDRDEIVALLAGAHQDRAVRVVILRANGRHFCTGADVTGVGAGAEPGAGDVTRRIMGGAQRLISAILDCDKPVVSVVQGAAAGMGAHIAYASDFVVASTSAAFVESFVLRGLTVDAGGAYLLPRLIGLQRAKELALLGDRLSAIDAQGLGLVNRVVEPDELDDAAAEIAARFAAGATSAIALTKRLFNASLDADRAAAFAAEAYVQELQSRSSDVTEGIASFLEKRPARFRGW